MGRNETSWFTRKTINIRSGCDVDTDGIPMCPVVEDGQWGKISYKTKYDSLSGAVILYNTFLFE